MRILTVKSNVTNMESRMRVLASVCKASVVLLSVVTAVAGNAVFHMAPLFSDNMVLQQHSEVPIWGNGFPGSIIKVSASWGDKASTQVRADGSWSMMIGTPLAGGPFTIEVAHDGVFTSLKNVMVGEVWLCSGQSNMEMPMRGWPPSDTVINAAGEIAGPARPDIRFFTVTRACSPVAEERCEGTWVECTPSTVPEFSATAYFFGKKLYEDLHVPIGLIHSSWGGTPIESWMSAEYLSRVSYYDTTLQKLREAVGKMALMEEWLAR
jgi:sialate O-acetylesterase